MSMGDKWPEMDKGLEDRIDGLMASMPVRRKKIFGTSAWFMESNGQMFAGVWADGIMVRVGEEEARSLTGSGGAESFDPMGGRPMREYVFIDGEKIAEDGELLNWIERGAGFAATLATKVKKSRKKQA
ncbi:MAG: TfoX/Sxy family protein [Chloroflexi bacterium]|nr:TfoX/Sxy family protein [Chloroflexota bacterium]